MPDHDDETDDTNPRATGPFRPADGPPTPEEIEGYLDRVRRALYGDAKPAQPGTARPAPAPKRRRR